MILYAAGRVKHAKLEEVKTRIRQIFALGLVFNEARNDARSGKPSFFAMAVISA